MTARVSGSLLLVGLVALVLGGCARTLTPVGLDGQLAVFAADPANPVFGRSSDWLQLGSASNISHKIVYESATPVLEVTAGADNAALIRRTDAQLLATPFLFWSWSVRSGPPVHPVRLVVGFADAGVAPERGGLRDVFGRAEPPPFSRSVTLVWGASALQRGRLDVMPGGDAMKPRATYVVRGGRENRNRWWAENLDLSQLHARAWPDVDMANSRIVFTGISTHGGKSAGTMRISGLRLSR